MNSCVFCSIVAGTLPSHRIYESDRAIVILDIHPVNPGHALAIPKKHSTNIFDIERDDWLAVAEAVHAVAPAIERAVQADGVNITMNNREHAGQVIHHPHVHLIPRFKNDNFSRWPHKEYAQGEATEIAEKIRSVL